MGMKLIPAKKLLITAQRPEEPKTGAQPQTTSAQKLLPRDKWIEHPDFQKFRQLVKNKLQQLEKRFNHNFRTLPRKIPDQPRLQPVYGVTIDPPQIQPMYGVTIGPPQIQPMYGVTVEPPRIQPMYGATVGAPQLKKA